MRAGCTHAAFVVLFLSYYFFTCVGRRVHTDHRVSDAWRVMVSDGSCAGVCRDWVLKSGMLVAMSVYTYLRLMVDHGQTNLLPLRQREVDFCVGLLRERVR